MVVEVTNPNVTSSLQAAGAAPILIRGQKTFTGAANLGAVGACPIFNTTGAVLLDGFWVRCTTTLVDAVDGAHFVLGVTGDTAALADHSAIDLDTIITGSGLAFDSVKDGWGTNLASQGMGNPPPAIIDNVLMTVADQAITGGVLQFFALYRPLTSDGALALGTGMVAI